MSWNCPKCSYPNPDNLGACFKCGSTKTIVYYHPAPLRPEEHYVWIRNVGLHRMPSQIERQHRAIGVPLYAKNVDEQLHAARIWDYVVTLEECTCPDFEKRGKPCKHMYRLAHELGVFELESEPHNQAKPRVPPLPAPRLAHDTKAQSIIAIGCLILFVMFVVLPILIAGCRR